MKKALNILLLILLVAFMITSYITVNLDRNIALRHWLVDKFQKIEWEEPEKGIYYLGIDSVYSHNRLDFSEGKAFIDVEWIRDVDATFHYDEMLKKLVIIHEANMVEINLSGEVLVNQNTVNNNIEVYAEDGTVYLSLNELNKIPELYSIGFRAINENQREHIVLYNENIEYQKITPKHKTYITNSINSVNQFVDKAEIPRLSNIKKPQTALKALDVNEGYIVYSVNSDVYMAVSQETIGYILKNKFEEKIIEHKNKREKTDFYQKSYLPEEPIFLVWEAVYSYNPNTENIQYMPYVNTISPTWIDLTSSAGDISEKVSSNYLKWAREQNLSVWILATNSFNPDRTSELLHSYDARRNFINQVVEICIKNKISGINLDFENIYLRDKDALSHFVNELAWYASKFDIILSMDVTIMGGSDNWSKCYDHRLLGKIVDYLIIMTYDEHWASSPISGPVASYPWVENGLRRITEVVPPSKVVMGLPFYTRVWSETISKTRANAFDASSRAIGIKAQNNLIRERDLELIYSERDGLYFTAYIENDKINKIWVENAETLAKKASLVKELNLKGVACWRRGFEELDVYPAIANEFIDMD